MDIYIVVIFFLLQKNAAVTILMCILFILLEYLEVELLGHGV